MSVLTDLTEDLKLKVELLLAKRKYGVDGPPHTVDATAKGGMRSGKISELTVFAPLKPGGADRLRKIIELIDGDFGGALLVGTLHDMRCLLLDDDRALLFATTFDGDWDVYIEDFATKIPELLDLIFASVEGFPGIKDPGAKDFILNYQQKADGWFVAYPDQTVNDILRNKKSPKASTKCSTMRRRSARTSSFSAAHDAEPLQTPVRPPGGGAGAQPYSGLRAGRPAHALLRHPRATALR